MGLIRGMLRWTFKPVSSTVRTAKRICGSTVCPACGKADITTIKTLFGRKYHCQSCGYNFR